MPENLLIYSTLGIHKNPSKNRRQKSTPNNYTLSQMHLLTKFAWQSLNASFDLPILFTANEENKINLTYHTYRLIAKHLEPDFRGVIYCNMLVPEVELESIIWVASRFIYITVLPFDKS